MGTNFSHFVQKKYWFTVVSCVPLLLSACGTHTYHIVEAGDSLYSIGWAYGYDYRQVARWNSLSQPYRLSPGDRILLTPQKHKKNYRNSPKAVNINDKKQANIIDIQGKEKTKPAAVKQNATARHKKTTATVTALYWRWPTPGRLIQAYKHKGTHNKGIKLAGRQGQRIKAAESGRIVYAGNGLLGYGNLIIIKHNNEFLSAYGHNKRMLVREGDYIQAGQQIAEMGSTGTDRIMLHFEIRKSGKPVNPLQYLPARQLVN